MSRKTAVSRRTVFGSVFAAISVPDDPEPSRDSLHNAVPAIDGFTNLRTVPKQCKRS